MRVGLVVPTRNPGALWCRWQTAVKAQALALGVELTGAVVDSASTDGPSFDGLPSGWRLLGIDAEKFNHGGTRNLAMQHLPSGTDVVVFLTQDALLSGSGSLQALLCAFSNPAVACAYGRQLPHDDASPVAAHARLFNYPARSHVVSLEDKARMGLKTCFMSNSFAAYRVADLQAVGGFPSDVILGEDMIAAARLLMAGKRSAYVAEACVYHSHNYSAAQEFRRYFDTGVLHARQPWLLQAFGGAGGEGARFVRSEFNYLLRHAPSWIPGALLRTVVKWLGYKLGQQEARWPLSFNRWCSMHRNFWSRACP